MSGKVEFKCCHTSETLLTSSLPYTKRLFQGLSLAELPANFRYQNIVKMEEIERRRRIVRDRYALLRADHPALPSVLRDFQVQGACLGACSRSMSWLLTPLLIKADLIWAATDPDDRQHLLGAVPTGYGKSLPMLVAALLLTNLP